MTRLEICLSDLKYISCNGQYRDSPFAQPTRRPVRNRRSGRPLCGTLGIKNHAEGKGGMGTKVCRIPGYISFNQQ